MASTLEEPTFWEVAADAFASDALELTILPTEQCNLRCTYCYESFELGRMSPEVVASVKNLVQARIPDLRRITLDWFGGEPLLALDVIEEISGFVQDSSAERDIEYEGSITTNGVLLTGDYAGRLSRVGVRHLHVSLDGPEEIHNRTRRLRSGRETFARIMKNLREIRDSDVETRVDLRVHVTHQNAAALPQFADELVEQFLHDERFTVYFFPIVDLGGPNQGDFDVLDARRAAALVRDLSARVAPAQTGRRAKKKGCESAYVCYAAKPNAWVVRSNGRLARCTVGLEDELNDLGRILPDGRLEVRSDLLTPWLRGWKDGDRLALHCPYEDLRSDVQSGTVASRR